MTQMLLGTLCGFALLTSGLWLGWSLIAKTQQIHHRTLLLLLLLFPPALVGVGIFLSSTESGNGAAWYLAAGILIMLGIDIVLKIHNAKPAKTLPHITITITNAPYTIE